MINIKKPEEIAKMRKAGRILASTLKYIESFIKPGIKTITLDNLVEEYILAQGALPGFKGYRGYQHATCLSVNEQVVHGIPSERELMPGDIIGIDSGVIVDNYYADSAYTFKVNTVSERVDDLLKATQEGLAAGIAAVKAEKPLGEVSNAIETVANKYGFSVVKDLFGHGIGKSLHEDPLIPNFGPKDQGPIMKAGMTFAIEPMFNCGTSTIKTLDDGWTIVTKDGKLSAHFEHTVLVTANGCEVLTAHGQ